MKVLQVNVVYKKGSTGKIVHDLHNFLKHNGVDSIVCYGRGKKIIEDNVYKISNEIISKLNALRSRITGLQYNGAIIATHKLIKIIKRENPDVVHLHCLNGYFINIYKIVSFLKKNNINTILTLHAEFMHTGNCAHAINCDKWKTGCGRCPKLRYATKSYFLDRTHKAWIKMKNAFDNFNNIIIVGVSNWVVERAKTSPIFYNKQFKVIHNGIETENIFYRKLEEANQLRKRLNIENDEKVILHVTPNFNSEIKGGEYLLQLAYNLKKYKCKFIIVGLKTKKTILPTNVIGIEHTNNQYELSIYYSLADLLVITSKQDNYPTVCIESISCGTPVVGFDVGGIKETIHDGFGCVVPPYNIDELTSATLYWVNMKKSIKEEYLKTVVDYHSKDRMCNDYINLYNLFVKRN